MPFELKEQKGMILHFGRVLGSATLDYGTH